VTYSYDRTASLEDPWLNQVDVQAVCPPCAAKMASLNIRQIKASALFGQDILKLAGEKSAEKWETLPKGWTEESLKKFWNSMTGERKHRITACMKKMEGKVSDPGAFCGGLASRLGER
jgi:hypothetical protein